MVRPRHSQPKRSASATPPATTRLRPHPTERFAPPTHFFDLNETSRKLELEPAPTLQGHRQEALYSHGLVTIALFHFEPQGAIREQVVINGTVFLHVLEGRLRVETELDSHDLPAGSLLAIAPGVRHDILAQDKSRLLMAVSLEK